MSTATQFYQQLKCLAQQTHHRQLYCLQGSQSWCFKQAIEVIEYESIDYNWCGESPTNVTSTPYKSLLGQDTQLLILNMQQNFDANMFAAAEGSVCGGAIIVLLLPEEINATDYFYQYIIQQLSLHQFPLLKEQGLASFLTQANDLTKVRVNNLHLIEQQYAIESIIQTVTGHRRRPLVLTANRGRGKSAALGIAAATLVNRGLSKILICAPSKQAVSTLYKHAALILDDPNNHIKLEFIAPDALALEKPSCDLLIIDEAAAIPIKQLVAFTKHYSRLVFATTQFGYEGSGRGFALRFQQQLKEIAPNYRNLHLNQAIRWAENDPVEKFTLSSLCLMEITPLLKPIEDQLHSPTIEIINKADLIQQPKLLNQLFSLLVNAHYQTKPSDLVTLLNDQQQSIIAVQQNNQILGIALINNEGGFDKDISQQIYQGQRRPKGHLIAQSLTFHSGFKLAATQSYARIQRIAIQPLLQKKLLGSQLLDWIINWAKAKEFDHISASFAGSDYLLRFWLRHQLQILRIGTRKDKSSGEHSFMVNLPLSLQGKELHHQIQTDFKKQVKIQLSRQLKYLNPELIVLLWPQIISKQSTPAIEQPLIAYTEANQSYENIEYLLIELLYTRSLDALSSKQQHCIIQKVIQNHSWQEIVQQHNFTGQKQAHAFLKNCICELLAQPSST
ncbi:tRNA(Met) cytidine acetyltransferase TmcA [Psychromonas algarum]|uniref:tRNA(Met) cytidine acetyltransferase TmcA n=1 Tax=Psychromonas algarum TaxID=2555643 RepID=UPI001FBB6863|nr:GNAT family N-acetyltransferase [Psychromonas sp. RZ22]